MTPRRIKLKRESRTLCEVNFVDWRRWCLVTTWRHWRWSLRSTSIHALRPSSSSFSSTRLDSAAAASVSWTCSPDVAPSQPLHCRRDAIADVRETSGETSRTRVTMKNWDIHDALHGYTEWSTFKLKLQDACSETWRQKKSFIQNLGDFEGEKSWDNLQFSPIFLYKLISRYIRRK